MAVTKRQAQLFLAFSGIVLIVSFQNCAVEVSDETPGAASSCAPSTQELTNFEAAVTTILQNSATLGGGKTACGSCHLTTSGNSASARLGILPGTDSASQTTNWCSIEPKAQSLLQGYLISNHPGGSYSDSEVQALIDWANTLL